MQILEAAVAERANPWPLRRERAAELGARQPGRGFHKRQAVALAPPVPRTLCGGGRRRRAAANARQVSCDPEARQGRTERPPPAPSCARPRPAR